MFLFNNKIELLSDKVFPPKVVKKKKQIVEEACKNL